jgi:hypothetical protein
MEQRVTHYLHEDREAAIEFLTRPLGFCADAQGHHWYFAPPIPEPIGDG